MNDIFSQAEAWQAAGEDVALATLVETRGSTPRPAGARLIMTRSGLIHGSVSGGCVEADVFERALRVLDNGRPEYAEYGIADEMGFEVGLACGGTINVLIEPFHMDTAFEALRSAIQTKERAVLAMAVAPEQLAGKRLLVTSERAIGGINASVDAEVADDARVLIGQESAQLKTYGEASVFLETFAPPARLFIVGATHVGAALAQIASNVGFSVTVIDARGLFATPERFPGIEVVQDWPDRAMKTLGVDDETYVAVLTHDPKFDLPALEFALRSSARYIGAMGSRKTQAQKRQTLKDEGFSESDLARIHGPIGLDLGARTPEEVAVSILAEIVAARYGRLDQSISPTG